MRHCGRRRGGRDAQRRSGISGRGGMAGCPALSSSRVHASVSCGLTEAQNLHSCTVIITNLWPLPPTARRHARAAAQLGLARPLSHVARLPDRPPLLCQSLQAARVRVQRFVRPHAACMGACQQSMQASCPNRPAICNCPCRVPAIVWPAPHSACCWFAPGGLAPKAAPKSSSPVAAPRCLGSSSIACSMARLLLLAVSALLAGGPPPPSTRSLGAAGGPGM